ncbi:MAG TPA: bifunctional acetate--CoA ligase family protein/GNAT family N-acetyltransferase [Saprospiraceae bacterium]|nr:bifunctional acetate--CoA ligase family protein/GNAT family N-acetyltransferase [Saprospiraceae bacterium]
MQKQLSKILKPQTMAIIGASNRKGSVGNGVMKNMLNAGYHGIIYPVNIKEKAIQGVLAYSSISNIPAKIDMAVICTPAPTVPGIVEECGQAGVGGLVIISSGFAEAGEEGRALYDSILEKARQYKMRIIGPNCLGIINPRLGINASFAPKMALPGKLALISQSGALLSSILDWSVEQRVGFSHFVSLGSMMDVDFAALMDYFGTDAHTSCILIYMESMKNARRFMSAARSISRFKPVIVLKSGRSEAGSKATFSHTGTLAGNDAVFDAAFERSGIIRVDTVAQLFNMAQAVAMQPRPVGNRLAIVTNAGGPGVLATDYLIRHGGQIAELGAETLQKIGEKLAPSWSKSNPIDVLGDAGAEEYAHAINICAKAPEVDGILVILTPQSMTDPEGIAKAVVETAVNIRKPVLASWMGERDVNPGREVLEAGSVANYRYPESAVDVFLRMYRYTKDLELLYETPPATPEGFNPDKEAARTIFDKAYAENRHNLMESEAKALLHHYDIEVSRNKVCENPEAAVAFAEEIGYPVVLKIASSDISHKTDAGGVKLNIRTESELRNTYQQIIDNAKQYNPEAQIEGILVERMVKKGHELLIGAKKDPVFGPVVVFGRGGVAVELYKDTRMGLPPLNMALAARMVENTQIYQLLKGYRGMPGINLDELYYLLIKFAYLLIDFPEIEEFDINPFVVDEKGGIALDARVKLAPADTEKSAKLVISPYPKQWVKEVKLKKDQRATFRPVRPEDEPTMFRFLEEVSSESMYMRFFGFVPRFTHNLMTRFVNIDYDREMAIVAEVEEKGLKKIIGVVRIIEDAWRETAEYSILISDKWHGKGLGNSLTDYILEIARKREISKIVATVLASNKAMIHIFQRRGFEFERVDLESFEVELELNQ